MRQSRKSAQAYESRHSSKRRLNSDVPEKYRIHLFAARRASGRIQWYSGRFLGASSAQLRCLGDHCGAISLASIAQPTAGPCPAAATPIAQLTVHRVPFFGARSCLAELAGRFALPAHTVTSLPQSWPCSRWRDSRAGWESSWSGCSTFGVVRICSTRFIRVLSVSGSSQVSWVPLTSSDRRGTAALNHARACVPTPASG